MRLACYKDSSKSTGSGLGEDAGGIAVKTQLSHLWRRPPFPFCPERITHFLEMLKEKNV